MQELQIVQTIKEQFCKYILPCGWCDKYDRYCDTFRQYTKEQIKLNNLNQEYNDE